MGVPNMDVGPALVLLGWGCVIGIPLAVWKAVEIALWLAAHVSVTVQ